MPKVTISVRLDPELHDSLRKMATEQERSMSSIVLAALYEWLEGVPMDDILAWHPERRNA